MGFTGRSTGYWDMSSNRTVGPRSILYLGFLAQDVSGGLYYVLPAIAIHHTHQRHKVKGPSDLGLELLELCKK